MYLIEVFLPLDRGDGSPIPRGRIQSIVEHLANRFGGATAFLRSPAKGLWKAKDEVEEDRIVIIEVMVDSIDPAWWQAYRLSLEAEFAQEEVLIRASECRRL